MGIPYRNYAAKLSIPGKSNDELTYTFYESSLEHQHAPLTLFGVFSIKSTSEQYQLLIAETVKNFLDYYRKISESSSGTLKQDGVNSQEFIFENAIQYTHEHVTHALLEAQDEHGKVQSIDMKKVNFVLGVICEGQLYASITGGGIHAIYFYPVYQKHGFSHYASVDVIHGNKEGAEHSGSSRLFASMISGSVSIPRSILAVCNNSFLDYISVEQLKQAATGNPIEAVAPYFQRLLGKIHAKNDFCAIFLDAHYTPSAAARAHQQTVSNESMAVLNSKEEGTEKILFPAFAAQIRKIIPLLWRGIVFCIHTIIKNVRVWIPRAYKTLTSSFAKMNEKRKTIRIHIPRPSKSPKSSEAPKLFDEMDIPETIKVPERAMAQEVPIPTKKTPNFPPLILKIREYIQRFLQTIMQKILQIFQNIQRVLASKLALLPDTSKSLLFISIVFLVLFGMSIIIIQKKNTEQKQQRVSTGILQSAEENSDAAEASLIYDNTEKARALLTQAEQVLRDFPTDDKKNQERHKKILERIRTITERINHVTPLNFTALSQLDSSIPSTDGIKIASSDDHILLYTTSSAYTVDIANGAIRTLQTQTKIPSISCGIGFKKTNFYLCDTETKRIFSLDSTTDSIQPIPLKLAKDETSLDSITLYNQRLYVLSAAQGILFRHNKNKDGFDTGTSSIKGLTLDPQALSLAIDGSIYILQSGGQIFKYTSGKKELFILPIMNPQPTTIQKIWTDADSSLLYLFEPSQKRILAVDKKTRALKAQFTSDILTSAKDFAFLPKKKILLVLSGSTLYQSPLDPK